MYDMHYDLLTYLYVNMNDNNKFSHKDKYIEHLRKMYSKNNVLGGFINLYFMPEEQMKNELDISNYEVKNVKEMFVKSICLLDDMKTLNVIPQNTNFIYSIEGGDYIENLHDLEELYLLGLRSILPVWYYKNKYGSGTRANGGLTEEGVKLIKKCIDLGIVIDISHANKMTFDGILEVYEKNKKEKSILIASHSNVKAICNNDRNLDDTQLLRLKNAGGYISLVLYSKFIINGEETDYDICQRKFMDHLDYIINNIGFSTDKIMIATDNMEILSAEYKKCVVIEVENLKARLYEMISLKYGHEVAIKIIKENAENLIKKLKS